MFVNKKYRYRAEKILIEFGAFDFRGQLIESFSSDGSMVVCDAESLATEHSKEERNLDPRALLLTEGEKSSGEP